MNHTFVHYRCHIDMSIYIMLVLSISVYVLSLGVDCPLPTSPLSELIFKDDVHRFSSNSAIFFMGELTTGLHRWTHECIRSAATNH